MDASNELVYCFLKNVEKDFPISISSKTDIEEFSKKLCKFATLCIKAEDDRIIALVAGYTNDIESNIAYISLVATLPEARNKGLASHLVKEFIDCAKNKKMKLVHLYTDKRNDAAIKMYRKIGFTDYILETEPRPEDIHLVYYIERD